MPSIKYKKKTYAGATFPVLEMTKAEYDALPEAKKMDGTVYMITDDTGGWEAENASYDNTTSGLTATNVQDALDEVSNAEGVSYDNTTSGLSATNMQSALDEVTSYSVLTFSDYFTVSSGFTVNGRKLIKVAPHLAYFHLDMNGTFGAGQTIFGSCVTGKIKEVCYIAGRCSMGGSAYPASGVLIPSGNMRIHCQGASTSAVLNGYVFI